MPTQARRTFRVAGWLAFGLAEVALHIWPSGPLYSVLLVLIAASAAVLHAATALRSEGRLRLVWALAAVGFVWWAIAELQVGMPALITGVPGQRDGIGNVLNLGALVLGIVGMLLLPAAPRGTAGRLRMVFDGVVTASSLLGAVWMAVLSPMIEVEGSSRRAIIDLAYPVLAILLLAVALLLLTGQPVGRINAMTTLTAGIAVLTAALISEVVEAVTHRTALHPWVQGGLLAAAVLIGIAPLTRVPNKRDRAWQPTTMVGVLLPYLPVAGYAVTASFYVLHKRELSPAVVYTGLTMLAAVFGRHILAMRQNTALTRDLAAERSRYAYEAAHDALTGLPNRAMLTSALRDRDLQLTTDQLSDVSLLMLDLDGFKLVNDTLGHAAGDELLVQVAARLQAAVADLDAAALPARLGGDEFAVLVRIGGQAAAEALAKDVLERLAAPIVLGGRPSAVRASIGIACMPPDGDGQSLLPHADLALYAAKHHAKGDYRVYGPSMSAEVEARMQLEADLSRALHDDELSLVYQPIIDLATGGSRGAEALLRWHHPQRGVLAPGAFLDAAADAGVLPDFDRWVLATVCGQLVKWRTTHPNYNVSINLSAAYLATGTVTADVSRQLSVHGLPGPALTVEVTETALIANLDEAANTLRELRAMGVTVALDDFGVGYSSLTYLRRLPVDVLKIDRSFIGDLDDDSEAGILVGAVLALAQNLGLDCVAEGVDDERQVTRLQALGCERAQGYLFARPQPPEQLPALASGLRVTLDRP
jgi:diguanylate cyclase (GGDEF)-like protein